MTTASVAGLAIVAVLAVLPACTTIAVARDRAEGSTTHRFRLAGTGEPLVVFESGLGDTMAPWNDVVAQVSRATRTFTYNRAGYAGSPRAEGPRDAAAVVDELRSLLAAQGLPPPYVLVGHSLGGLYMQYYARNFPEEVAGLVLVDSTHWDQTATMRRETPALASLMQSMSRIMPGAGRAEFAAMEATEQEVRQSPRLRPLPVTVLSAGQRLQPAQPLRAALEGPFAKHLDAMQLDLVAQLPEARHVIAKRSDHYIQR
ncbi:MAG: alpha/beta fold hydrolase, partial [Burkholderiales bacterium]|nr:alpha/beta fold hydrolase [Burkholderiales bacterium]